MKKSVVLALLLSALLACGCSDDEKSAGDTNEWAIVFNETIYTDAKPVVKTDKFFFDQERLIKHSVTQKHEGGENSYEVMLSYSDQEVRVTSDGSTSVYALNAEGYASRCTYSNAYQSREYVFTYSTDGYLTEMTESIDQTVCSTTTLTYRDGDLSSIASHQDTFSNKINYESGAESCKYYLPCLDVLETYPFTLHTEALYAGLLGKAPTHLTARSKPEGSESEYITYTYQFDEKGNPTYLQSKTTYSGSEDGSHNYYPNLRRIAVTIG